MIPRKEQLFRKLNTFNLLTFRRKVLNFNSQNSVNNKTGAEG